VVVVLVAPAAWIESDCAVPAALAVAAAVAFFVTKERGLALLLGAAGLVLLVLTVL